MKDRHFSLMDTIAAFSILVLALLVTTFTVLYFLRSPWWKNKVGEIYLFKSTLISLVLLQGALSIFWSMDYPGRVWVRTIIYVGGAIAYVPMIIALVKEQNRDRRRERVKREAEAKEHLRLLREERSKEDQPPLF